MAASRTMKAGEVRRAKVILRLAGSLRAIVDEAHRVVTQLLTENRDKLDSLTERLLEKETVDQDEAYEAAGVPLPSSTADEAPAVAQRCSLEVIGQPNANLVTRPLSADREKARHRASFPISGNSCPLNV